MAEIIWTEPALSDLNDIAEYIALDNPNAAKSLVQSIFEAVDRLIMFPESGRIPPELAYLNYREVVIPPCRVFYKYDKKSDKIEIVFVMREERDLVKYLRKK